MEAFPPEPPYKCLVVGETGSGKTCLIKFLSGLKAVGESAESLKGLHRFCHTGGSTVRPGKHAVSVEGGALELLDTPGFADNDVESDEHDEEHARHVAEAVRSARYLNSVILVVDGRQSSLRPSSMRALGTLAALLPDGFLDRIVVVFSHVASAEDCSFPAAELRGMLGGDSFFVHLENPLGPLGDLSEGDINEAVALGFNSKLEAGVRAASELLQAVGGQDSSETEFGEEDEDAEDAEDSEVEGSRVSISAEKSKMLVQRGAEILRSRAALVRKISSEFVEDERVKQSVELIKAKTKEIVESEKVQQAAQYVKDKTKEIGESESFQKGYEIAKDTTVKGVEIAKATPAAVVSGAKGTWERGKGEIKRAKAIVNAQTWRGSVHDTLDIAAQDEEWKGLKVQGADELAVPARTEHTCSFFVNKGSTLRWTFRVQDFDIGFSVRKRIQEWGGSREDNILALERYEHTDTISGSWVLEEDCMLVVGFDNTHSLLRSKTVAYIIGTHSGPSLSAQVLADIGATPPTTPTAAQTVEALAMMGAVSPPGMTPTSEVVFASTPAPSEVPLAPVSIAPPQAPTPPPTMTGDPVSRGRIALQAAAVFPQDLSSSTAAEESVKNNLATSSAEPASLTEPALLAEPSQPKDQALPAETVSLADTALPAEPAEPASLTEPAPPAQSAPPAPPVHPEEQTAQAESATAEHTAPPELPEPAAPAESAAPAEPAAPLSPSEAVAEPQSSEASPAPDPAPPATADARPRAIV